MRPSIDGSRVTFYLISTSFTSLLSIILGQMVSLVIHHLKMILLRRMILRIGWIAPTPSLFLYSTTTFPYPAGQLISPGILPVPHLSDVFQSSSPLPGLSTRSYHARQRPLPKMPRLTGSTISSIPMLTLLTFQIQSSPPSLMPPPIFFCSTDPCTVRNHMDVINSSFPLSVDMDSSERPMMTLVIRVYSPFGHACCYVFGGPCWSTMSSSTPRPAMNARSGRQRDCTFNLLCRLSEGYSTRSTSIPW